MDITSMLQFGPKKTFTPEEDAPSIYADPSEWQAHRAQTMLMAALDVNQQMAETSQYMEDGATDRLVAELAAGEDSMAREIMSLTARYPAQTALSAQKSMPSPDDKPFLPAGQNPQHAKQDLINKNWNSEGIQAFTDFKGQLVLTNNMSAKNATEAMRPFKPVESIQATGGAAKILGQIKSASNLSEAQGNLFALQSAVTEKAGQYQVEAINFAEKKVGLPAMKVELQNAIAADRQDPLYKPGMGDSPITAKIRTQVMALEDQAQQEAERYLSRNVGFAQLKNTLTMAQAEMQRFARIEERQENREAQAEARRDEWNWRKEAELDLKAGQVPTETRRRILDLHPELANTEKPEQAILAQATQYAKAKGKDAEIALTAPASELPRWAVRGNAMAEQLVIKEEAMATGESVDTITGRIANTRALLSDPKFVQKAMNAKFASAPDKTAKVKEATSEYNRLSNSQSAEDKERFNALKAEMALEFVRATATERFTADLSRLQTTNAKFGEAVRMALKNTGSASLENVAAAWTGEVTGPEAIASYNALLAILDVEAMKYRSSIFGAPNMVAVRAAVNEMARSQFTVLGRVRNFLKPSDNVNMAERGMAVGSPLLRAFTAGTQEIGNAIERSTNPRIGQ